MAKILHVQSTDWHGIVTSDKLVLVDFWADWCAPCRMLAPTFEKLGEKYGDQITFAKVDVDALPDLAKPYGVRWIATLSLLHGGSVVERLVGLRPYEELARLLDRHGTSPAVTFRTLPTSSPKRSAARPAR